MSTIECKHITKRYRGVNSLDNLSFSIKPNTITGLIGRNGAGKTTLLKTIAGFYQPTSGEVEVFSKNPFNNLQVSSNLLFIDDNMLFPPGLTLREILESAASFYPNWDANLANRLFTYFQLKPKQHHHHLSKGMKSTFNMIIGLSSRCPVTIFDEPTTGMDAAVRKDFYKALLKDYIDHPRTILFSSHLLNEIDSFLEDVLLIKKGQLVLHLPVTELKEYAVGLRGKKSVIVEFTKHLEVLHEEEFGTDYVFTVVKSERSTWQEAKKCGVEVFPIATDDLCMYLTAEFKGGINDVFNRD
ncbi:ABC transporter ATP-binding protein [Fredinandcohnia humi]